MDTNGGNTMNPIQLMKINETNMTRSEIKIMNYIIESPQKLANSSIIDFALAANTSKSALLRFCHKLGYEGFSAFKYDVAHYIEHTGPRLNDIETSSIANIYADTIKQLDYTLEVEQLAKLTQYLKTSRKIKVFGYAETGLSAIFFSQRLLQFGFDVEPIVTVGSINLKIEVSTKEDLLIFFTLSANTTVIKSALELATSLGLTTVLVTQNAMTELKSQVNCFLLLSCFDESASAFILEPQIILYGFSGIFMNYLAKSLLVTTD